MQTFLGSGRKGEMCVTDTHSLVCCGLVGIIDKVVVRCAGERGAWEGARPPQKHFSAQSGICRLRESAVVSHDVGDYSKCLVAREVYGVSSFSLYHSLFVPVWRVAKVTLLKSIVLAFKSTFKQIQSAVSILAWYIFFLLRLFMTCKGNLAWNCYLIWYIFPLLKTNLKRASQIHKVGFCTN
jgi:hypothetical protein